MHKLHWLKGGRSPLFKILLSSALRVAGEEKNGEFVVVVVGLVELEFDSADFGSEEVVDYCNDQALY